MNSLPADFVNKMKNLLGEEFDDFINSYDKPRAYGLRVNTLKVSIDDFVRQAPFKLSKIPWAPDGFYYSPDCEPGKHLYHEAGLYYIQEPSAMLPAVLLDPKPGERILDLCAAPGGKSTQIASAMKGSGLLVANEIHAGRAKILSQNIERMGIKNCVVLNENPAQLEAHFNEFFHGILVDAPCSGEGMFRKNPEARNEWSPDNVSLCARRQLNILDSAAKMLMPGGRLVYSTCTFSPEENEQVIEKFLLEHPEFEIISPTSLQNENLKDSFDQGRPSWTLTGIEDVSKAIRIWPHKVQGEGHFVAVLKKNEAPIQELSYDNFAVRKELHRNYKKNPDKSKLDFYMDFARQFLTSFPDRGFSLFGEHLYIIPEGMISLDGLKVVRPGWHLGTFKKNRFEPSHALALSLNPQAVKQCINLDSNSDDIYSYLRGEAISCSDQKGWTLVLVDGYPIGWGKASNNVLKNHYPKGLRLHI